MDCAVKAYEGQDSFIFVSYAHDDAHLVYPIVERMVMDGYRVWYDDGIHAGEDWTDKVASRLDASSIVLAMLSENSVASINCRNEIAYSLSARKNLIGIKLTEFDMPGGLRLQLGNTMYLERARYGETEFYERLSLSHGMGSCRGEDRRITDEELIRWRDKWSNAMPIRRARRDGEKVVLHGPAVSSAASPSAAGAVENRSAGKTPLFVGLAVVAVLAVLLIVLLPKLQSGAGETASAPSAEPVVSSAAQGGVQTQSSAGASSTTGTQSSAGTSSTTGTQSSAGQAVSSDASAPALVSGSWDYGELRITVKDEKTLSVELTDMRVPDGYPFSETPGNNDPSWNLILCFDNNIRGQVYLSGGSSFSTLSTTLFFESGSDILSSSMAGYSFSGNTFSFDVTIPGLLPSTVADLQLVYVNLGTEQPNLVDHYEFNTDSSALVPASMSGELQLVAAAVRAQIESEQFAAWRKLYQSMTGDKPRHSPEVTDVLHYQIEDFEGVPVDGYLVNIAAEIAWWSDEAAQQGRIGSQFQLFVSSDGTLVTDSITSGAEVWNGDYSTDEGKTIYLLWMFGAMMNDELEGNFVNSTETKTAWTAAEIDAVNALLK